MLKNEEQIKAGGSRNKGIEQERGEYIIFLDSDDINYAKQLETKLEKSQK